MSAPVLILVVDEVEPTIPALNTRQVLGFGLYDVAMHGGIALSDRYGCWTTMAGFCPEPIPRDDRDGAHRVALDAIQHHARCLDAACRAALARAEKVAEHATGDEAHAALAEISDLIASALVGVPPPT